MQQARPLNRKSNLPLNQQFPDERDFSGGFGQASSTSRRSPVAVISKAAITLFGAGEANGQHALPLLTRASPVTVVASSLADEPPPFGAGAGPSPRNCSQRQSQIVRRRALYLLTASTRTIQVALARRRLPQTGWADLSVQSAFAELVKWPPSNVARVVRDARGDDRPEAPCLELLRWGGTVAPIAGYRSSGPDCRPIVEHAVVER